MACQNSMVERSPDSIAKKAKRQVSISTFEKWQRNYDREYQTDVAEMQSWRTVPWPRAISVVLGV